MLFICFNLFFIFILFLQVMEEKTLCFCSKVLRYVWNPDSGKKVISAAIFSCFFYDLVVNITFQEATKKAQEQASERVKCLEEDLGKLR